MGEVSTKGGFAGAFPPANGDGESARPPSLPPFFLQHCFPLAAATTTTAAAVATVGGGGGWAERSLGDGLQGDYLVGGREGRRGEGRGRRVYKLGRKGLEK